MSKAARAKREPHEETRLSRLTALLAEEKPQEEPDFNEANVPRWLLLQDYSGPSGAPPWAVLLSDLAEAIEYTREHVDDTGSGYVTRCIVDLDTGEAYEPEYSVTFPGAPEGA